MRIGIGIHAGPAVVGRMAGAGAYLTAVMTPCTHPRGWNRRRRITVRSWSYRRTSPARRPRSRPSRARPGGAQPRRLSAKEYRVIIFRFVLTAGGPTAISLRVRRWSTVRRATRPRHVDSVSPALAP
jgi:hypothetical protein